MDKWIIILVAVLSSCSNHNRIRFEPHFPKHSTNELISSLDTAYALNDSEKLKKYFEHWNLEIRPNEKKYIEQEERIKLVYEIFRTFYIPSDPFNAETREEFFIPDNSSEYYIIQNKIYYCVYADDDYPHFPVNRNRMDSINNFKPPLEHLGQKRILYLTNEYFNALNGFLDPVYKGLETESISTQSISEEESWNRYNFLSKYINISSGHWGLNWQLHTSPTIFFILINNRLNYAEIHFRFNSEGGVATLEKEKEKWIIKSSTLNWIE